MDREDMENQEKFENVIEAGKRLETFSRNTDSTEKHGMTAGSRLNSSWGTSAAHIVLCRHHRSIPSCWCGRWETLSPLPFRHCPWRFHAPETWVRQLR